MKPILRLLLIVMIVTIIPWIIQFCLNGKEIFNYFDEIDNW